MVVWCTGVFPRDLRSCSTNRFHTPSTESLNGIHRQNIPRFYVMKVLRILVLCSVALAYQQFCKCQCNDKHLVGKIDVCGSCTKEWCLQQDSDLCQPNETTDSMIISCFQNESRKEQAIVFGFIIAVVALLVCSVVPSRAES